MTTVINADDARQRFGELLKAASEGHTTIITYYGIQVAALVPLDQLRPTEADMRRHDRIQGVQP